MKHAKKKKPPKLIMHAVREGASVQCYLIMDGVRIAKRGEFGTPHARTWISLEPGVTVLDGPDLEYIEVSVNGVRVQ